MVIFNAWPCQSDSTLTDWKHDQNQRGGGGGHHTHSGCRPCNIAKCYINGYVFTSYACDFEAKLFVSARRKSLLNIFGYFLMTEWFNLNPT